jgi:transposase
MEQVIIGVDPHKLSATIEVVDVHGRLLGSGRYGTDKAGYAAMRAYAKNWHARTWAIEGANGAGRPLAQRLVEAGEHVLDVPAKLAARARAFDTGHNRKTDALDAHSIAMVAVRTQGLRVVTLMANSKRCGCSPTAATSWRGNGCRRSIDSSDCSTN